MEISVVIPMYNSQDSIINALNSIKNQTAYENILEIIIVNDGSTDDSIDIVKEYIKNNKKMPIIIINKKNGGVSSARNIGIQKAKCDWIALLDADDFWLEDKIETQVNIIKKNNNIDFLGGDMDDKGVKIFLKKINKLHKVKLFELCLKTFPQTSTVIFRKKIFQEIGGYDENKKYAEDFNYFLKICNNYEYYYFPQKMICYGNDKLGFGVSGLSKNLKEMNNSYMKSIKELKDEKIINLMFYIFLYVFYILKYIRRIIIIKYKIKK